SPRCEPRAVPNCQACSAEPMRAQPPKPSRGQRHCYADDYASLSWTASLDIALLRLSAAICADVNRRTGLSVLTHQNLLALAMAVTEHDDVSRARPARTNGPSDDCRLGLLALVLFLLIRRSGLARAVAKRAQSKRHGTNLLRLRQDLGLSRRQFQRRGLA